MKIICKDKENRETLLAMMAWIEHCCYIGHSCQYFKVGVDGDGAADIKFEPETKEEKEEYKAIKEKIAKDYNETHQDLKVVDFE